MGRYYAQAADLDPAVAAACEAHYRPLGPGDSVPEAPVSVAVALADKIDMLTGFWAIDEKPTGSKDPFALRRAALGVIRLVLGNAVKVQLAEIMRTALNESARNIEAACIKAAHSQNISDEEYPAFSERFGTAKLWAYLTEVTEIEEGHRKALDIGQEYLDLSSDLLAFLHERLKVHLRDEGVRHDVIDACLSMPGNDDLVLVVFRARALQEVLNTEDGENLVQGFKRANNILTQAEDRDGVEYSFGPDQKFAETEEEKALFAALDAAEAGIAEAVAEEDFGRAMAAMAGLRAPIDAFFESVQINTDSPVVRRNRLNLLGRIRQICLQAADLTRLEG
jgi:glycyl-tRNA synthetase beta chain